MTQPTAENSITTTMDSETPPALRQRTVVRSAPRRSVVSRLAGFFGWVLTGFGAFSIFKKKGQHFSTEEIVVYCVHRSFFLWPLILIGFVGGWIVNHHPAAAVIMGWIYIWVLLATMVTLLFDVGTWKLLLWAGIFLFAWFLSKYFEELRHLILLSWVRQYLRSLQPALDPGFAVVTSWLLLGPWVGALFHSFSRGRKTFTPNGIEEWYLGEGCELTDRAGLKFRTNYRDLFESVLGLGAGDLIAYDVSHHVVKHWENVLFLAFFWPRLDEILHQRAAVVDNNADDPVEVESIRRKRETSLK